MSAIIEGKQYKHNMIKKSIAQNGNNFFFPWYGGPRNKEHSKQQIGNQFGKS
jgi:hypothetical protein